MPNNTSRPATNHNYLMPDPECYIFLHHVKNIKGTDGALILLPSYADSVNDTIQVSFNSNTPLARSSPIFSYSNSGPRSLQVHFDLHRDMMWQLNYQQSNLPINESDGDDYVDIMAREIQAAALPTYNVSEKMVNPPLVSLRLGNDIFIKGVISGSVGVSYGLPILESKKYAIVKIDFGVTEVTPFSAEDVIRMGSFRGMSRTLADRNSWVPASSSNVTYGSGLIV